MALETWFLRRQHNTFFSGSEMVHWMGFFPLFILMYTSSKRIVSNPNSNVTGYFLNTTVALSPLLDNPSGRKTEKKKSLATTEKP